MLFKKKKQKPYDVILVGAGLFNGVLADRLKEKNKRILVIEKRNHIGGNCYTEEVDGITVHKYGAHIFHTSDYNVWTYINKFTTFEEYKHSPIANYKDEIYNLPFNMNTFNKLFGVITPEQAKNAIIKDSIYNGGVIEDPRNLEEYAIKSVGKTIYQKLVKCYTEKQWGTECKNLPPSLIKRLPLRFTYDNNYFNDYFQGIPEIGGYTHILDMMFEDCDIIYNTDFLKDKEKYLDMADEIYYSGSIDEYFNYTYGPLEYRSLRFEEEKYDVENYQGCAVMNFTDNETPYTRIIEHKHFNQMQLNNTSTIITKEYSEKWEPGKECFYPINNEKNDELYKKYQKLADNSNVHFVGRLGLYKYLDMDDTIRLALEMKI